MPVAVFYVVLQAYTRLQEEPDEIDADSDDAQRQDEANNTGNDAPDKANGEYCHNEDDDWCEIFHAIASRKAMIWLSEVIQYSNTPGK